MRIRSGDTAIIVHAGTASDNGLIVHVLYPDVDCVQRPTKPSTWWCSTAMPVAVTASKDTAQTCVGPVPESSLFPIRGGGFEGLLTRNAWEWDLADIA